ncbi:MAG: VWA domain-containing protein [Elusimicrobia bacterium]|nr:VWA domain-containing protein [Elusimicrobiota bacterium]
MRFANPIWLLLALPAAAAAVAAAKWIDPSRAAMPFPDGASIKTPWGRWTRLLAWTPSGLKAAAIILAAIAMARPQAVEREIKSLSQGIDILLTIDTSMSMLAIDFDPMDRITAAKRTAAKFVQGRTNDRIGVVVFGGVPLMGCPLTMDYAAVLDYVSGIEAGMTQTEGTAIGDAIVSSVSRLKGSSAKSKVAILLTDGANNAGIIDPVTAAKSAAAFGIKLYAIGAAKRGPALVPIDGPFGRQLGRIPDELNEDVLTQIAETTGGRYFRATNFRELDEIYREIDRLERTEVSKPPIVAYADLHAWLLLPAALLLILEMSLARTLLLRIP